LPTAGALAQLVTGFATAKDSVDGIFLPGAQQISQGTAQLKMN
jgi:putative membrane protein